MFRKVDRHIDMGVAGVRGSRADFPKGREQDWYKLGSKSEQRDIDFSSSQALPKSVYSQIQWMVMLSAQQAVKDQLSTQSCFESHLSLILRQVPGCSCQSLASWMCLLHSRLDVRAFGRDPEASSSNASNRMKSVLRTRIRNVWTTMLRGRIIRLCFPGCHKTISNHH